jgi:hypothetical protein
MIVDVGAAARADLADAVPTAPIANLDPYDLGVHVATLPAGSWHGVHALGPTPYLQRTHDGPLRAEVRQAAAGGPSVLALVIGDSTTGKTRALYEAINGHEEVRRWPALRPADADELKALLGEGRITAGTVLWLNETQKFLYGTDGEKAALGLVRLLESTRQIIVVGAMWRVYEDDLARGGIPGDPTAGARELLDGPHTRKIYVPNRMTPTEQGALARLPGSDTRLAIAVATSGEEGQVIQHLTGGPELLDLYLNGGLFTPVEHALITAALEARRLGHIASLPASLLAGAADGYLTGRQRPGGADWASTALADITAGVRSKDATRTDVRRTLTALTEYRASAGQAEATYEPNDFLDQNTRAQRLAQVGTPHLWDALAWHAATAEDLYRLGRAAHARGLYRHAAIMWFRAVGIGHPMAAAPLLRAIVRTDNAASGEAAEWIAEHAALDDPGGAAALLRALQRGEIRQQVGEMLAARTAEHVSLDRPIEVANLIGVLRRAGQDVAVAGLAGRAAELVPFDNPRGVAELLNVLVEAEADEAVAVLAARAPQETTLDSPRGVALLIRALHRGGADAAAAGLALRAAQQVSLDAPRGIVLMIRVLRQAGANEALATLLGRDPAAQTSLNSLRGVAALIRALHQAEADAAASVLAARVVEDVSLDDPRGVAYLLRALRKAGMMDPAKALLARAASTSQLEGRPDLVQVLREAGASEAVAALAALAASIGDPGSLSDSICILREIGADAGVAVLAARAAEQAALDNPRAVAALIGVLRWAKQDDAVTTLVARTACVHVDSAHAAAYLIRALSAAEEDEAVTVVAARAVEQVALDSARGVGELLQALRQANATDAIAVLLSRDPARHASLGDMGAGNRLYRELREAGANEQATEFLVRSVDSGADEYLFTELIQTTARPADARLFRQFGREPDSRPSRPWGWRDLRQE